MFNQQHTRFTGGKYQHLFHLNETIFYSLADEELCVFADSTNGWKWSAEDCENMVEALVCESHIGQESVFCAKQKAISLGK